jgi:cytoskeletal protein RodZ
MKKLLLASMFVIGISGIAAAQNPEAVRAKKEAAKKEKNEPAMTNAAQETSIQPATAKSKEAVKQKTDAQAAKEEEVKKQEEAKKAAAPAKVKKEN